MSTRILTVPERAGRAARPLPRATTSSSTSWPEQFATFSADTVTALDRRAVRTEQFAAASRGELHAVVHELLPLRQAVLAHQEMDAGEVFGRVVLMPGRE